MLSAFSNEVTRLSLLQPPAALAANFHAAVGDDTTLVGMLRSMLARPDYVHLAVTLPGHPGLEPAWLKAWLARSHALASDVQARFTALHMPACAGAP